MAETISGIRTWRPHLDLDGSDAVAGPPSGDGCDARAVRVAPEALRRAPARDAVSDPCLDFAAPDHDFDRCVLATVPNPVLFGKQDSADADAVDPKDVQQGKLGDCFILAPLAALAGTPAGRALIRSAIVENKSDSGDVVGWTVTLHQPEHRLWGKTTFSEVRIAVTAPYVLGHARVRWGNDGQGEVWPLVIEKAYAQYAGGYNSIGRGGRPSEAMEVLTGQEVTHVTFGWFKGLFRSYGAEELRADFANGKMVVLSSKPGISGKTDAHGLLGGHAYFVKGIELRDGKTFLRLGNPWGKTDPDPIPCDELAQWFSGVAIGSVR